MTVLHSKSPEVATLAPAGKASEVVVDQNATGNESNLRAPTSKPKAQALAEYGLTALFFIVFCGPAFLEVISQYWRCEGNTDVSKAIARGEIRVTRKESIVLMLITKIVFQFQEF